MLGIHYTAEYVQAAAAATTNGAVLAFRISLVVPDPPATVYPSGYQRFPFFSGVAGPVSPIIQYRVGGGLLEGLRAEPWSYPGYQRFPYLDAALFPAKPVIQFRYSQYPFAPTEINILPQRFPVPSQPTVAPASPVIRFRYGLPVQEADQRLVSTSQYFAFTPPRFQTAPIIPIRSVLFPFEQPLPPVPSLFYVYPWQSTAIAPANPAIGLRTGQLWPEQPQTVPGSTVFLFPYRTAVLPASPGISFRYGNLPLADLPVWIISSYQAFPYQATIPSPVPISMCYGRLPLAGQPEWSISAYYAFPWRGTVGTVGTVQLIVVRGNRPHGTDDYMESWFG